MREGLAVETRLSPLQHNVPITNPDGTPTAYFIQLLQQWRDEKAITDELAADAVPNSRVIATIAGLTGGGDLSADRTLAADVQAILNQITTTRGSVLYRGSSLWSALTPGTSGFFLKTNGAGADPAWAAAGGGGGGALTPPLAATFPTRINNGLETQVADGIDSLVMAVDGPAASATNRMMLKAMGAAPRYYVAKIALQSEGITSDGCGVVVRDSATGKFIKFGLNLSDPLLLILQKWNSPTSFSVTSKSASSQAAAHAWFRVVDSGIDLIFQLGLSNVGWITFYSESKTAFMATPDQFGFGIEDETQPSSWLAVMHYAEAAIAPDPGPYRFGRIRHTATPGAFVAWTAAEFMATVGGANLATVPAQGFADSFFGGLPPSNAYDANAATWWACNGTGTSSYIAYDFLGSPTPLLQVALTSRNDGSWGQNATAIAVDGTNDGIIWYNKFNAAGIVWTGPNQRILFS